jgi:Flp pilus assembly pilin Flp
LCARGARFAFEEETPMRRVIARVLREDSGQDLIEYSLLAAFISLIAIASITSIGGVVNTWYEGYDTTIRTIPGGGS